MNVLCRIEVSTITSRSINFNAEDLMGYVCHREYYTVTLLLVLPLNTYDETNCDLLLMVRNLNFNLRALTSYYGTLWRILLWVFDRISVEYFHMGTFWLKHSTLNVVLVTCISVSFHDIRSLGLCYIYIVIISAIVLPEACYLCNAYHSPWCHRWSRAVVNLLNMVI